MIRASFPITKLLWPLTRGVEASNWNLCVPSPLVAPWHNVNNYSEQRAYAEKRGTHMLSAPLASSLYVWLLRDNNFDGENCWVHCWKPPRLSQNCADRNYSAQVCVGVNKNYEQIISWRASRHFSSLLLILHMYICGERGGMRESALSHTQSSAIPCSLEFIQF